MEIRFQTTINGIVYDCIASSTDEVRAIINELNGAPEEDTKKDFTLTKSQRRVLAAIAEWPFAATSALFGNGALELYLAERGIEWEDVENVLFELPLFEEVDPDWKRDQK
jgi:hypothetical protein